MRMFARRVAVAVVVILASAGVASAQTADEIIEKSIAAMGGRAAMEKAKTRLMVGTIAIGTPAGDIAGTVEMHAAAPNKQRMVLKADLTQFGAGQLVVDQRFDGTTGYVMDSMQGNREITGNQLDNMKAQSFPHAFLNYKATGMSVKLGPNEKVGDRDAFVLIMEPAAGSPIKQYVDAESFLPTRIVIKTDVPQVGNIEQTMDPSDFRTVDGTKIPFALKISNAMQNISMTFTKIENNVAVDEKMFVKP
jgi:outer membrane lipoprotein-sorting protein